MAIKRIHSVLLLAWMSVAVFAANNVIDIPLTMSVFAQMPQDNPTGSTPDPTDPNQFRASLTGNTLLIETQKDAVSYVVIQETESDRGEDYFYDLSYGSVTCPINHAGLYIIRIGYWKTDFVGHLRVQKVILVDIYGHYWGDSLEHLNTLPAGIYIIRIETTLGTTTLKFLQP